MQYRTDTRQQSTPVHLPSIREVRNKILMFSWEFPPQVVGGLGRHVAELTPSLASQGVEVHIVTPHSESNQWWQQIQVNLFVHRVTKPIILPEMDIYALAQETNDWLTQAAKTLWQDIGGFDVIHVHDWLVAFAGLTMQKRYHCPLISTIHATEKGRWRNGELPNDLSRAIDQLERQLIQSSEQIIACSHYMNTELSQEFGIANNKIVVIPNGINLNNQAHYVPESLKQFRAKYAAPEQALIFSVGRLVYEKGYQVLVGAMPHVLAKFPQAKLVLAGTGPLLPELQDEIAYFNLQEHVQLVGFITDVERDMFFSVSDCAVFPSLYEPFGIVALEAMAANCPVIVSKTGGLAEVVMHERNGLHIYPDNSDSTAWGILQILEKPQNAAQYAENALTHLKTTFNWLGIAEATRGVYQRVI